MVTVRHQGAFGQRLRSLLCVTLALMAAGCIDAHARLRTGLHRAGLSLSMADCMAARMVDQLTTSQLRRIGRLGQVRDDLLRDPSADEFLRNIEALGDPAILAVASTSAVACRLMTR